MRLLFSLIISCLFLLGCVNPIQSHITTMKLAFRLNEDAKVSLQDVKQSEVDLALISSGDRPQAVIAKAFDEFGKEKWISQDRAMLVIEHGRVIRTLGFDNDLLSVTGIGVDPLSELSSVDGKKWQWLLDWEVGEYGYLVESTFSSSLITTSILEMEFEVIHVIEECDYKLANSSFDFGSSWTNQYWIEKNTGILLKTEQKSAPFSDRFEVTFVSNAINLNKN